MGKKIDGFVLSVLAAAVLYLYFYRASGNHAVSFVLAGLCFVLVRRLFHKTAALFRENKWIKRRHMRRQTGSTLMQLACANAAYAEQTVAVLLQKGYGCQYPLEIVQMHPSSQLSTEIIFEIWKKHQGEERLVLCATCNCSTENRILCKSLKQPQLALLDAEAISQLIAEHPENVFVQEDAPRRRKMQFSRIAALIIRRKNAPRCLMFSLPMLLLYLMSANIFYLIAAMFLLFVALASLRRVSRPAKLF